MRAPDQVQVPGGMRARPRFISIFACILHFIRLVLHGDDHRADQRRGQQQPDDFQRQT